MRPVGATCTLPVELSPEDLAVKAKELATATVEVEKQELAIEEAKGVWSAKKKAMEGYLSHLKGDANHLAEVVDTGVEEREVACSWLYALKEGAAFLVRDDTGVLVRGRHLEQSQRQESLLDGVIREPTPEQLAAWLPELGIDPSPQAELPLEGHDDDFVPAQGGGGQD